MGCQGHVPTSLQLRHNWQWCDYWPRCTERQQLQSNLGGTFELGRERDRLQTDREPLWGSWSQMGGGETRRRRTAQAAQEQQAIVLKA